MIPTRVIIVFLGMAVAAPVHAQPAGAQAEVLFREGRSLMMAGRVAEACAAFDQSHKLEPARTALLHRAVCREKLGQLATAWGLFLDVERQTRFASDQVTEQLYKVAHAHAIKLEPRVPKLTISVPERSRIEGLEIMRDQENIPAVMWNRALPVDGGSYTITARVAGANEWSMRVTLEPETDTKTVDIPDLRNLERDLAPHRAAPFGMVQPSEPPNMKAAPPGTAEAPASPKREAVPPGVGEPAESPKPPDTPIRRYPFLTIAASTGAVVLFGSALMFSLRADATYASAKAEMKNLTMRQVLYDSANHKRYTAVGLAAAGVGCAGAAVWLYLRERGARAESGSAHAARVMLAPTGAGVGVAGWF